MFSKRSNDNFYIILYRQVFSWLDNLINMNYIVNLLLFFMTRQCLFSLLLKAIMIFDTQY